LAQVTVVIHSPLGYFITNNINMTSHSSERKEAGCWMMTFASSGAMMAAASSHALRDADADVG